MCGLPWAYETQAWSPSMFSWGALCAGLWIFQVSHSQVRGEGSPEGRSAVQPQAPGGWYIAKWARDPPQPWPQLCLNLAISLGNAISHLCSRLHPTHTVRGSAFLEHLSSISHFAPGWANFVCKGSGSKYFWLCGPWGPYRSDSTPPL